MANGSTLSRSLKRPPMSARTMHYLSILEATSATKVSGWGQSTPRFPEGSLSKTCRRAWMWWRLYRASSLYPMTFSRPSPSTVGRYLYTIQKRRKRTNKIVGARFYYIRTILHNWDKENSIKILKNTAAAIGADSQLLINEIALPNKDVY